MKITAIKAQVKRAGRYSIFVDDEYSFSLSDTALLDSGITSGQELTEQQLRDYKRLSGDDKLYNQVLGYIALRPRSEWEIQVYLERKEAGAELIEQIVQKLRRLELVDDTRFAQSFVRDRQLLKPTSRRKLQMELKKKHIAEDAIRAAFDSEEQNDQAALQEMVVRKRRQSKYQDNAKLMQYLAGQGFNYNDIKRALNEEEQYD